MAKNIFKNGSAKLSSKIFRGITAVVIAGVVITAIISSALFYAEFSREIKSEIKSETRYLAELADTVGVSELKSAVPDGRVTMIAADGSVVFDSRADGEAAENHSSRPEIKQALESGEGESTRVSKTFGKKNYYYALRLSDGGVIRVSRETSSMFGAVFGAAPGILLAVLLLIGLAMAAAGALTRSIIKPINDLDLDAPLEYEAYEELDPLLNRVDEQNKKMLTQINEAREAEKMRREFSANVSHELKTPLTTIMGCSEILKEGIVDPKDVNGFLERINSESKRLLALIDDIISLSGLDEGGGNIEMTDADLLEIAREAAESLEFKAEKRGISISVSGNEQTVRGSRGLLHEMIYNLCDNAVRYNRDGGYVKITVGGEGGRPFVSVRDNGIGIPEADRERVFERFYRVDKSHSKETGGTGLGLSIVKHAAQIHGAEINLKSEPGKGTEIKIIFPKSKFQA